MAAGVGAPTRLAEEMTDEGRFKKEGVSGRVAFLLVCKQLWRCIPNLYCQKLNYTSSARLSCYVQGELPQDGLRVGFIGKNAAKYARIRCDGCCCKLEFIDVISNPALRG